MTDYLDDTVLFAVQHIFLVTLAAYAFIRDVFDSGPSILRGDTSLVNFWNTLSFSAVVVTLINQCAVQAENKWYSNHTVALNVLDITMIAYLCLWSRWGRNSIVKIAGAVKKREE